MNWYLAEVHMNREAMVAYTMRCLGIEPFLPLILRMERISTRTKRRELAAVPALQGYLFFRTEPDWITDVDAIRDVKGIFKASDKMAYATIPDREMQSFILAHDKWPIGDPKQPDFRFCGHPQHEGKPYCTAHCAVAYAPPKVRLRDAYNYRRAA